MCVCMVHTQLHFTKDISFTLLSHGSCSLVTFTENDTTIHMCTWSTRKLKKEKATKGVWEVDPVRSPYRAIMHLTDLVRSILIGGIYCNFMFYICLMLKILTVRSRYNGSDPLNAWQCNVTNYTGSEFIAINKFEQSCIQRTWTVPTWSDSLVS